MASNTTYYYKLSAGASAYIGYELMNALDFKNGSTDASMFSVWAEGSTATGAVAAGWLPIGTVSTSYTATFEGNSHTISNLFIDRSHNFIGLFGWVSGGALRNLGLEEANVAGWSDVGALASRIENSTVVVSCYSTGSINAENNGGGLVGWAEGGSSFTGCYATSSVVNTGNRTGGLVGYVEGTLNQLLCYGQCREWC